MASIKADVPALSPSERLVALEQRVAALEVKNEMLLIFSEAVNENFRVLLDIFQQFPKILNQDMPAVRATEVRKLSQRVQHMQLPLPNEVTE